MFGGDSNSLHKFRLNETAKCKLLEFEGKSHAWPAFVYQQYDASFAADKIIQFLNRLNIGNYGFYDIFLFRLLSIIPRKAVTPQ